MDLAAFDRAFKIDPMVTKTFPLLEVRKALELLATGTVVGKIAIEAA